MSASTKPVLQLVDVEKKFRDKSVLAEVNLTVWPGDIVVLVGPNGAGKTTLLKMIAGFINPSAGKVEHFLPRRERRYLSDEPTLQDNLTVRENIMYAAMAYGIAKAEFESLAARLLQRYGLEGDADSFPGALSYGMQRKASICVSLVTSPRILLADEPLSGLDGDSLERFVEDLKGIIERGGAVILSTHHFEPIRGVANRVVRIKDQRVREVALSELTGRDGQYLSNPDVKLGD